ncbi:magnesium transporter CorA family protein [Hydrogenoanaerobacterium sp.]|uniref:magnesium transporter CorA family protein n=1 Tax=Hydrogenoanaerobacterium sp. TaxID=2953763 RepID=UPI00289DE205|nr:magnesium transporter CorA family protein [Hydrogenoanaerobacterium sp.]
MINYYKTIDNRITQIDEIEDGCWVSAVCPTESEVAFLTENLGIDQGFVKSSLDEEETSRIEQEEDQTLLIVDLPLAEKQPENTILYTTTPIGIIMLPKQLVTITLKNNPLISEFAEGMVKNVQTKLKNQFLFTMLLRIATRYLQFLKQIDKLSMRMEHQLHKSMKNKELIQLLGLEKSLVYFSTSLKANEMTMEKILRGRIIKLYEDDQDLLEDVLIETKQAIEMCNIYASILSGTMDAFASVISNNLNIVMKVLTSITILMAIPTMVSSFYGMNVEGLPLPYFWFPCALAAVLTVIVAIILVKKNMFY